MATPEGQLLYILDG